MSGEWLFFLPNLYIVFGSAKLVNSLSPAQLQIAARLISFYGSFNILYILVEYTCSQAHSSMHRLYNLTDEETSGRTGQKHQTRDTVRACETGVAGNEGRRKQQGHTVEGK